MTQTAQTPRAGDALEADTAEQRPARWWARPWAVGVGATAAFVTLGVRDPQTSGAYPFQCPFAAITGADCPGCGSTRALSDLARGNFTEAADHNVMLVIAVVAGVIWWFRWMLTDSGVIGERPVSKGRPRLIFSVAAVVVAFWLLRNVGGPFGWLHSTT